MKVVRTRTAGTKIGIPKIVCERRPELHDSWINGDRIVHERGPWLASHPVEVYPMNAAPHSPASVEHFAEVVARLAAPFAVREAVLRDAGLDERAWLKLEEHWTARLAADGALVDRYVARYRAITTGAILEEPKAAELPVILVTDTKTRPPAPLLARPAVVATPPSALRLDGTLKPDDVAAFRAALPFLKGSPAAHITTPGPAKPPVDPRRVDATLELGASLPLPLLSPLAAPEAAMPGKRLHRFDSKTGAPLPVPVWIDEPADPKKLA
jgi:hypothetical protein